MHQDIIATCRSWYAVILIFNGTPMTFKGKDQYVSLQGDTVNVSRGPAAAMIAIKQLGTNGGGYFGANSAVPFENPNYFTNMVENICIILNPDGNGFRTGTYIEKKKTGLGDFCRDDHWIFKFRDPLRLF